MVSPQSIIHMIVITIVIIIERIVHCYLWNYYRSSSNCIETGIILFINVRIIDNQYRWTCSNNKYKWWCHHNITDKANLMIKSISILVMLIILENNNYHKYRFKNYNNNIQHIILVIPKIINNNMINSNRSIKKKLENNKIEMIYKSIVVLIFLYISSTRNQV